MILPPKHEIKMDVAVEEWQYLKQNLEGDVGKVVVFFKSERIVKKEGKCTKECNKASTCIVVPFSSMDQCQCTKNFDGDLCNEKSQTSFSNDMKLLLSSSINIPKVTDIFYKLEDARKDLAVGFGNIEMKLQLMSKAFETTFTQYKDEMKNAFHDNKLSVYDNTIKEIESDSKKANHLFTLAGQQKEIEKTKFATDLVRTLKIINWKSTMQQLFKGRWHVSKGEIKPLLILKMNTYKNEACSQSYKNKIDLTYGLFSLLQVDMFSTYSKAKNFLNESTEDIPKMLTALQRDQVRSRNFQVD